MKIPKPAFTPEFWGLAVKRVKAGESVEGVAKELGLVEQIQSALPKHAFQTLQYETDIDEPLGPD